MVKNISTENVENVSICNIDRSSLNYEKIKKDIVHSINKLFGIKNGSHINIAKGNIPHPDNFEKRKSAVLSFNSYED